MLDLVLAKLNTGTMEKFARAEEIMREAGAVWCISELVDRIVQRIIEQDGWYVDPEEETLKVVVEKSDFPEVFEVVLNTVQCDWERLFEKMYDEDMEYDDLNEQSRYLLKRAGISPDEYDRWKEKLEENIEA